MATFQGSGVWLHAGLFKFQRKLKFCESFCESYVFTGVCLSSGGSVQGGLPDRHTPGQRSPWTEPPYGNVRVVRILLECILVLHSVSSQLILKNAYMLDILIPHIVHMTYFDYTLPVFQNFEKTIWQQKTWMKFNQVFWHKLFSHILKWIVKELKEKKQKFRFSKLYQFTCNRPSWPPPPQV